MKMNSSLSNKSGRALRKVAAFSLNSRASITRSITLSILAASILGTHQAGAQILDWAVSYNGIPASALEEVEGVVADGAGNVFATGLSGNGTGSAICTMKLSPRGTIQWSRVDSKASLCGGMWGRTPLTQDAAGNLIVVGADRKSTRLNSSHVRISYAVFCLKKKKQERRESARIRHLRRSDGRGCTECHRDTTRAMTARRRRAVLRTSR